MTTTFEIQNLKCHGCANTIKEKLSHLNDVKDISVDVEKSMVTFTVEKEDSIAPVKTLLAKIGYPLKGEENALTTKAKSFVSCAVGRMNS